LDLAGDELVTRLLVPTHT